MNERASLADKGLILIASKLFVFAAQIGSGAILVRWLSRAQYGTFRQVLLICSTAAIILAIGIPKSIYYFVPQLEVAQRKQFCLQVLILIVLIGSAASLGIYALQERLAKWMNNPELPGLAALIGVYLIFLLADSCTEAVFLSLGRAKLAAMLGMISAWGQIISILIPLLLGYKIGGVLSGILVFHSLKFLYVLLYLLKLPGKLGLGFRFITLSQLIKYSAPLGFSALFAILTRKIDQFMVAYWYLPEAFAVFSRGAFQLPFISVITYNLSNLLLPRYVELGHSSQIKEMLLLWQEVTRKIALLIFPIFVFMFLIAEEFITFLFTDNYAGSVEIFRIYLFLMPMSITVYGGILQALGDTKSIMNITVMTFLLCIVSNYTFYKLFGFAGPALATVAVLLLSMFWYLKKICSNRRVKENHFAFKNIFPWRELVKILLISICSAIVFPLSLLGGGKLSKMVLLGVSYPLTYFLLVRVFKVLKPSDKETLSRWANKLGLIFAGKQRLKSPG